MYLIYGKGKVGNAVKNLCDQQGIVCEIKDDSDEKIDFKKYEKIIPSPGVPSSHEIYSTGKILSELDFAYQFLPKKFKIYSVTGTDGKSTVSWILSEIFKKEYGDDLVYLSGNFDIPFSETVWKILEKNQKKGHIVLEISSFMAYGIKNFQTDYTLFTNLKSDHLDWHADHDEYIGAKYELCKRTIKKIYTSKEVEDVYKKNSDFQPEKYRIIGKKDRFEDGEIIVSGRRKFSLQDTNFFWEHNGFNLTLCSMLFSEIKICSKRVKKYLAEIYPLSHRMEIISRDHDRVWIDDGKATSPQSVQAALRAFGKLIVLIAGGKDKGSDFSVLREDFKEFVKYVICIGETKNIFSDLAGEGKYEYAESMEEAVKKAYKNSKDWDIIILSPGCSSFDMFRNYLDRSEQFKKNIKAL